MLVRNINNLVKTSQVIITSIWTNRQRVSLVGQFSKTIVAGINIVLTYDFGGKCCRVKCLFSSIATYRFFQRYRGFRQEIQAVFLELLVKRHIILITNP